jgi:2-alkenal reductase
MNRRSKQYLWIGGAFIIIISLFTGAVIGSMIGYVAANGWPSQSQPIVVRSVSAIGPDGTQSDPAAVTAAIPSAAGESQSLVITEESATVEAVGKVLPAVVTVLAQGWRGPGGGSGFFINEEGYVVTNNHVVEGAQDITVIYARGGRAAATLVGGAPEFDLAVLKVDGPAPAVAEWGDSGELPLGAHVIAIGSALGEYQNTVTGGILSGFNRQIADMGGLLQTDAAINQGNSGGPLINLGGQVIGINTLVVRGQLSEAEGLGFAIPSNVARNVVRNLIETGDARHPFLGIQYQPLNPQLANEIQLSINEGALLDTVIPGTPADRAGLRAGDVIVAIDGQPVDDRHPLVSLLLEHLAGDTITLEILRDGQILETELTLGERA